MSDTEATGVPADGTLDDTADDMLGGKGVHHWKRSTITTEGLGDRSDVFFAAIEMTRMPMALTDPRQPDNPIAFANNAFFDLTGYEEAEVVGRNCRFLQGAGTDRDTVAQVAAAIAKRESVAVEILNYRRNGEPFWNALFIGPVFAPDGELLYFFASQLDVSRRREVEQGFAQAQKMEAVGQLTAGLAHDFNNLLQVVNGNLELLAAKTDDPKLGRHIAAAQAAAGRGAKLTQQLLAFARKTRLDPRPVALPELIEGFQSVIATAIGEAVALDWRLDPVPAVVLDPEQLEMALLNIVVNARHASADGATITVATRSLDGDAAIEVRDHGHGMPPSVVKRATDPFFTTKEVGKGTGLGLAMAKGFTQQSGGRMEIESTVGEGTTVRLVFPASDTAAEARPDERTVTHDQGGVERILVVEDSPDVLDLAEQMLGSVGYDVTTAVSGAEALQLLEAGQRFELLFTDLIMPGGINGLVLAERAGAIDPDMAVLMTTGYNEDLSNDAGGVGERDVIGKPYRRSDLLGRVRHALVRRGQPRGSHLPLPFGHVQQ